MKLRKLIPICLLIAFSSNLFAQTAEIKKTCAGIYTNYNFSKTEIVTEQSDTTNYIYETRTYDFFSLTPFIRINSKNNNFHELELSKLNFNKNIHITKLIYYELIDSTEMFSSFKENILKKEISGISTGFDIALRYEYDLKLFTNKSEKAYFFLGLGIQFYYANDITRPFLNQEIFYKTNSLSSNIYMIPRFVYNLNENVFLDLNFPLHYNEIGFDITKTNDPTISAQQSFIWDAEYKNNYSVRLGIGLRI